MFLNKRESERSTGGGKVRAASQEAGSEGSQIPDLSSLFGLSPDVEQRGPEPGEQEDAGTYTVRSLFADQGAWAGDEEAWTRLGWDEHECFASESDTVRRPSYFAPDGSVLPPTDAAFKQDLPLPLLSLLVVEDNEEARALLERVLQPHYDVQVVVDARSALDAMTRHTFDVLAIDINLGGKETGADVLRVARALPGYEAVTAVAVTAYALPGDRERFIEMGFDGYVAKPFTSSILLDELAAAGAPAGARG